MPFRTAASSTSTAAPSSTNTSGIQVEGEDDTVVCSCGLAARLFTVRKDGPNKGELATLASTCRRARLGPVFRDIGE